MPPVYALPSLADVQGRDLRTLCAVGIVPQIGQTNKILSKLPGKHDRVDVDADLPLLVETIRTEMRAQFGDGFDRP